VPSETFSHTSVASASIEDVWAALDEPQTWESIGGIDKVVDPIVDPEGRLQGFSFDTIVAGTPYRGEATPAGREEGLRIGWNIENSEISGSITVALSENGSNTSITTTLTVESKGMLASMFFPVIAKAIGSGLPRSLDAFAAEF
jgi:carbon monoxide dehydrogenase subunit G